MPQRPGIRSTQRAPRSCVPCSSRKVKCDKSVPCANCIRRGEADTCAREMVLVRGQLTRYRESPGVPTYEDLKDENERLRKELSIIRSQESHLKLSTPSGGEILASETLRPPSLKQPFDQDED